MYTVWNVDKYKITFKLVINRWTNEILHPIRVSSGPSRPGIIDARARYRVAARRLRNTGLEDSCLMPVIDGAFTPVYLLLFFFTSVIIYIQCNISTICFNSHGSDQMCPQCKDS